MRKLPYQIEIADNGALPEISYRAIFNTSPMHEVPQRTSESCIW